MHTRPCSGPPVGSSELLTSGLLERKAAHGSAVSAAGRQACAVSSGWWLVQFSENSLVKSQPIEELL